MGVKSCAPYKRNKRLWLSYSRPIRRILNAMFVVAGNKFVPRFKFRDLPELNNEEENEALLIVVDQVKKGDRRSEEAIKKCAQRGIQFEKLIAEFLGIPRNSQQGNGVHQYDFVLDSIRIDVKSLLGYCNSPALHKSESGLLDQINHPNGVDFFIFISYEECDDSELWLEAIVSKECMLRRLNNRKFLPVAVGDPRVLKSNELYYDDFAIVINHTYDGFHDREIVFDELVNKNCQILSEINSREEND